MPKIIGGHDPAIKKCWNDTYEPHPVTVGGINAVLRAGNKKNDGRNGASMLARIDYMRRAMNVGLVQDSSMRRAQKTIANLEAQL